MNNMIEKNQPTVEDLKAPLLAAVGAADLALATVNEIVASLRERAEEARTDATARLIDWAPWDPPNTSSTRSSSENPKCARASLRNAARSSVVIA